MSLRLFQSEDFLLDLEGQFRWYVFESRLEMPEAIELAQEFKAAVLDTLNFLLHNPKRVANDSLSLRTWQALGRGV